MVTGAATAVIGAVVISTGNTVRVASIVNTEVTGTTEAAAIGDIIPGSIAMSNVMVGIVPTALRDTATNGTSGMIVQNATSVRRDRALAALPGWK